MNILVANLGSTSVKYQLLSMPDETVLAQGKIERVQDYRAAVAQELETISHPVDAVAFKAVHGGPNYCGTYVVDEAVLAAMEEYLVAAPVHNRLYIDGMKAFQEAMPGTPIVAAFETEFHAEAPLQAKSYGIPADWRQRYGVRKYGFHGASHEYVSGRAAELLGLSTSSLRTISCHLGGSSSICAIRYGQAIDCTMGFSPQSGIESATRPGDLDVYAVMHLMKVLDMSFEDILSSLTVHGGLAGLSGVKGGDMRDVVAAMDEGSPDATNAFDVFAYQIKKTIGAYAAAMEGVDVIAFAGGIGENRYRLRSTICLGLGFLGVELSEEHNVEGGDDRVISSSDSSVRVLVIHTNEELVVARRSYNVLSEGSSKDMLWRSK
jgi:acetate kinase